MLSPSLSLRRNKTWGQMCLAAPCRGVTRLQCHLVVASLGCLVSPPSRCHLVMASLGHLVSPHITVSPSHGVTRLWRHLVVVPPGRSVTRTLGVTPIAVSPGRVVTRLWRHLVAASLRHLVSPHIMVSPHRGVTPSRCHPHRGVTRPRCHPACAALPVSPPRAPHFALTPRPKVLVFLGGGDTHTPTQRPLLSPGCPRVSPGCPRAAGGDCTSAGGAGSVCI